MFRIDDRVSDTIHPLRIAAFIGMIAACLFLSACASMGTGVSGNEMGVTVSNVWNRSAAFKHAEKHCAQYGKVARATGDGEDYHFSFDCVKPT